MEREILFRGKRVDNGEWVEGYYCPKPYSHFPCEDTIFPIETLNRCWEGFKILSETRGEYTGLTDKNGVKIFERDIVDILCENEEIGVIKWDKDTAQFIVSADGFCASFDNYFGHDLEVIGNVYDNPELLGGEEND